MLQTVETETFLLSILLTAGQKAFYETAVVIEPEDFDLPSHRAIYRAIGRVAQRAHPDWLLTWQALGEDAGLIDEQGGKAYLSSLSSLNVSRFNRKAYVESLRKSSETRRLRERLTRALDESDLTVSELAQQLYSLERRSTSGVSANEALRKLYTEAETPSAKTVEYPWEPVQKWTRGLKDGWLCYLAGETSHGKTAAAIELAETVARTGGSVLYVSLEMPDTDIAMRLAQRRGMDSGRVLVGKAESSDFKAMQDLISSEWTKDIHLEFADRVERLPGLVLRHKPRLLVVDYMGLLDIGRDSRLEGTGKNSRALKMLALQMRIPVVCLVQLSRAKDGERNKKPGLWRLRDTGQLENDADQVVFVWRERDEESHLLMKEGAMIVAKARNGETGEATMMFDGALQQLTVCYR